MIKGKGNNARQDLWKSNTNVEKPSHVRVRVLESQCKGFNPFCSINRRGIRQIEVSFVWYPFLSYLGILA
jgi:hypothetical protein